jgi:hypothetical protein
MSANILTPPIVPVSENTRPNSQFGDYVSDWQLFPEEVDDRPGKAADVDPILEAPGRDDLLIEVT